MTMTSITKIQRAVLQAAAMRNDHAAWPIREGNLNIGSATRTIKELIRKGLVVERPAVAKTPVWREDNDGRPLMAVVSDEGLAAIGMGRVGKKAKSGNMRTIAAKKAAAPSVLVKELRKPRTGSKLAALAELLQRKEGATIAEMMASTGWQAPSVRGVLSGMLAKKFAMLVTSEIDGGRGRVYRTRDR